MKSRLQSAGDHMIKGEASMQIRIIGACLTGQRRYSKYVVLDIFTDEQGKFKFTADVLSRVSNGVKTDSSKTRLLNI